MSDNNSPFVETEFATFEYPAPLDLPQEEDEEEVSHKARLEKINPEMAARTPKHWVKFRIPKSRGDVDKVADLTASRVIQNGDGDGIKFESRIARGNRGVFELLIDSWSFSGRPTGSEYDTLGLWAGDWIISCMAQVMEVGTKRDWAVKNGSSSTKPEVSDNATPSPAVEASA